MFIKMLEKLFHVESALAMHIGCISLNKGCTLFFVYFEDILNSLDLLYTPVHNILNTN